MSNQDPTSTSSSEYKAWQSMKTRCYKETARSKYYIKKGIKVCDRWLESFENFIEDMGQKPSKKHSLDRIDGNKNYSPENCRWATGRQQANNRRNNVILTYKGQSKSVCEWSRITGINKHTIYNRIKRGWETKRILEVIK